MREDFVRVRREKGTQEKTRNIREETRKETKTKEKKRKRKEPVIHFSEERKGERQGR